LKKLETKRFSADFAGSLGVFEKSKRNEEVKVTKNEAEIHFYSKTIKAASKNASSSSINGDMWKNHQDLNTSKFLKGREIQAVEIPRIDEISSPIKYKRARPQFIIKVITKKQVG